MVEIELRAIVDKDFIKRLQDKYQLTEIGAYGSSTDDYYRPKNNIEEYDPSKATMRIRKHDAQENAVVLLDEITYENGLKVSVHGEKLKLFSGPQDKAKKFLEKKGFEYWFIIRKLGGTIYNIVDNQSGLNFNFYLEKIKGLEDTIEVEFKTEGSEDNSGKITEILGINKENIISKNMASFVAERRGLI